MEKGGIPPTGVYTMKETPARPLPHIGLRNLKTALSASLCALIYFFLNRNPAFACIGAIFGMGADMDHSKLHGGNRLFGTVIGGFLGIGLYRIYLVFYPDGGRHLLLVPLLFGGIVVLILLAQIFWVGAVQPGGVVLCLLLFSIGLEMSGEELMRLKRPVFVGGTAQVVLTVGAFLCLGVLTGQTWQQSMMYGFLASLSSTAIVLSRLQQKAQSESPQGRLDFSVLIFQDIAVVPMMLAIPILAGRGDTDLGGMLVSAGRTLVILVGGWVLARHVVPRIMQLVLRTRSKELMLMTVLGLCFAIALGTASLGLSLALGAFLAGLLLSGSEYSLNVLEGILPFKDVFTSLFFISVGMLLDVGFLVHHLDKVFLFAALLIFLKSILSLPPMLLVGYPLRVSILAAMSLAQIGEFSFVLARSAVNSGLMDNDGYQMFLAASIVTMMLTPTVMEIAPKVASFVSRHMHMPVDEEAAAQRDESLKDHLIIVGFGVGGKHLARTAREAGIPYVILEMNPDTLFCQPGL